MALVKMKRSIAQKPEKRSDPTLGPAAAAGAIRQLTMMALVEIKKDDFMVGCARTFKQE